MRGCLVAFISSFPLFILQLGYLGLDFLQKLVLYYYNDCKYVKIVKYYVKIQFKEEIKNEFTGRKTGEEYG